MPLTLLVLAGFYEPAHHAIAYADGLAQAVGGRLVLLHINRAAPYDPYALAGPRGEPYRRAELARQTNTAEALRQQARRLGAPATVEIATDLGPALVHELAARHAPALFVLGQPDELHPDAAGLAAATAELLRAGSYPVLAVPPSAPASQPPHCFLLAADAEPFVLTAGALALQELLQKLATKAIVAHVSTGSADDESCSAALRAVEASGLLPTIVPELRGYEHPNYAQGLLEAIKDTQADLVVLLARPRSYFSELFHRSVTTQLLARCPVPTLLLPTVPEGAPLEATAQLAA